MGAMQNVMKKLRDQPVPDGDQASSAAAPHAAVPAPPANADPSAAATGTATAQSSAFVADPGGLPRTDRPGSAGETITWDARQVDRALVAFHERFSAASEQYRSLRARLLNMNPQQARQMILITSSLPQEGKSVTTVNLGMVMAEGGEHRVVIVDADFRRASIAHMFGIESRPGMAELIRGSAKLPEVLRPTQFPNLKIITAGSCPDKKYGELVGSAAVRSVLSQLREQFDYIFVDTPPVNTVSDVSMLAPHCDGAMIVVEMHRTSEPTVQEAVRTLQTTNVKILGCILSRYQRQRGHYYERYYNYYYGSE